ncbi:MAG: FAD-binding protein [Alphaproteobacteria bacterium]|jgi:succinate dehydrogenase/fumarate reductase flavoprotein subunit|nr:FAD-binding protein [Alphaproteobacteria bacterium]HJM91453.1 FAD-binding protein [Alphaproteobacteria bacterium]
MVIDTEWRDYDVIVVGSGGAGAHAAQAAVEAGARVLVVSKDPIGASDTKISGGIATVRESGADDDTEELLSENLKMAGADLPVQSITDAFARDSNSAYDSYRAQGLRPPIDIERNTPRPLPLPLGGHTKRRSVGHRNAGIAFGHANWNIIVQGGHGGNGIDYLEDAWFLDLVTEDTAPRKQIIGGLIYAAAEGVLLAVRAPSVVIAAGGLSTLYFPKTDAMRGNTGDSYGVVARAGADLVDMEQMQFLPFCITSPPSYEGLLAGEPVVASFLGVLRDKHGKVILDAVRLRTRAECAAAIMRAVEDGRGTDNGGAYLDLTANKRPPRSGPYFMRVLTGSMSSAYTNVRQAMGKAAANCDEPWEVRPGAHYLMGGIRVDADGASAGGEDLGFADQGIAGLYAAGQAMGGLFGSNRLGSTSLTEVAVFGARAGNSAARRAHETSTKSNDDAFAPLITAISNRFGQRGETAAATLRLELQRESWNNIGPVRTAERLDKLDALIVDLTARLETVAIPAYGTWNQAFLEFEELRNMLDTAKAVSAAARERDCSVGGHVRLDCKNISALSQPYSTVVNRVSADDWRVRRVRRDRTPLRQLISYKIREHKRLAQAKMLRLMPKGMQDRKLEKLYQAILGKAGQVPEVAPDSAKNAIGERTKA